MQDVDLLQAALAFYKLMVVWLASLLGGFHMPLPSVCPMEFASMPEHFVEDSMELLLFASRIPKALDTVNLVSFLAFSSVEHERCLYSHATTYTEVWNFLLFDFMSHSMSLCTFLNLKWCHAGRVHEFHSYVDGKSAACEESILKGKDGGSVERMDAFQTQVKQGLNAMSCICCIIASGVKFYYFITLNSASMAKADNVQKIENLNNVAQTYVLLCFLNTVMHQHWQAVWHHCLKGISWLCNTWCQIFSSYMLTLSSLEHIRRCLKF